MLKCKHIAFETKSVEINLEYAVMQKEEFEQSISLFRKLPIHHESF